MELACASTPGEHGFLDEVAPTAQAMHLRVHDLSAPLLAALTPEASEKLLKGNYDRLVDQARRRVRAWEKAHVR